MPKNLVLISMAFLFAISGCAFSKKPKKEAHPQSPISTLDANDQLAEQELSVKIVETPTFNEYFVEFSWPPAKKIRVELREDNRIIEASIENKFQLPIHGGETKSLFVTVYNSLGGNVFNKEISVTAPRDAIVSGTLIVGENQEWKLNRLFFEPNSSLNTNGSDLKISADRIEFGMGSLIETGGGKLATNPNQLKGSQIHIEARVAIGAVQVYLDGFDGRDGKNGDEIDILNEVKDEYLPELKGPSGAAGKSRFASPKSQSDEVCENHPTDGGPGKPGAQGTPGENGEDGGSTGSLVFAVQDVPNSSVNIEVLPRPGKPGLGGQGGKGRRGGQGGDPGKPATTACRNAKRGPDGPRGPQGTNGNNGAPGKVGIVTATPGVRLTIRN